MDANTNANTNVNVKINNMKIGFQCSSFDMLHAGHVTMLKQEKEMCDYLKVAL